MPQQKVWGGRIWCAYLYFWRFCILHCSQPSCQHSSLLLWGCGTSYLPVSLTHATEELLCDGRFFSPPEMEIYTHGSTCANFLLTIFYKLSLERNRKCHFTSEFIGCTGRPGGSESWEQCSVLWGWFSMCRFLSIRKQRSCSGLLPQLFGLTGNKGTAHCCFWWTKSEQKWWHHLSPRFLCNFKSSPWPGWTQAGLWTPFLWETTALAQMSQLHPSTGDLRAVICLNKTSVSCQPPTRTDLLLGQLPFCSVALWDGTHAL